MLVHCLIVGRSSGSDISSEERDCLFLQSRSCAVYGSAGVISQSAAWCCLANSCAAARVLPVAEK